MIRWVIFLFLEAVGARDLQESDATAVTHCHSLCIVSVVSVTLRSHSPFRNQLFDGDVGPHLSGEARERVLLFGQLTVQLGDVGLSLQGDVQAGLWDKM